MAWPIIAGLLELFGGGTAAAGGAAAAGIPAATSASGAALSAAPALGGISSGAASGLAAGGSAAGGAAAAAPALSTAGKWSMALDKMGGPKGVMEMMGSMGGPPLTPAGMPQLPQGPSPFVQQQPRRPPRQIRPNLGMGRIRGRGY